MYMYMQHNNYVPPITLVVPETIHKGHFCTLLLWNKGYVHEGYVHESSCLPPDAYNIHKLSTVARLKSHQRKLGNRLDIIAS